MVANTDQTAKVISLSASAIELMQRGNRTPEQIDKLIAALQEFKDGQSVRIKTARRPQIFAGNRCTRCGGFIDEVGICPCGYDHETQTDHQP